MEIQSSDLSIKGFNITIDQLNHVLENHPYFHLGLMEKSRILQKTNHIDSLNTIRKCAILFPDRSLLHSFLHENNEIDSATLNDENEIPIFKTELEADPKTETKSIEVKEFQIKDNEGIKTQEKTNLEKNYIIEAVNQSIQIEASHYSINDIIEKEAKNKEKLKNEEGIKVLSFSEWIGGSEVTKENSFESHNKLIDKFIQESPQISKLTDSSFYSPIEKGKQSISEETLPFSETLASIYIKQGNKALAIKAYRYLMLKNPQKSVYFADLIKKLEE
jgi:hypothetical protein